MASAAAAAACEAMVGSLEADIGRAEAALDAWVAQQKAAMTTQKEKHTATVLEEKENVTKLQSELNSVEDKGIMESKLADKQRADVAAVEEEIGGIRTEHARWLAQKQQLELELNEARAEKTRYLSEIEKHSAGTKDRISEMKMAAQFYEEHLGLRFESIKEGVLRFVFTHIDPENWDRQFTMVLTIDGEGKYIVDETAPAIAEIDAIVGLVNLNKDFSGFIQSVRSHFKALC